MKDVAVRQVQHPAGFVKNPVLIKGEGSPVVFLHGPFEREWGVFLDGLAEHRKVYAPAHAGSIDANDLDHLDGLSDLVLYYDDLFDALDIDEVDLIGHSFGGMVAAEYAATFTRRVRKLVLIDAMGLWNDNNPVEDHLLVSPERLASLLFHDVTNPVIAEKLRPPQDPEAVKTAYLARYLALASSSHFIHPIPERGLRRRLRRISAKTLIVWGAQDKLVPQSYAKEFASGIRDCRVQIIENAGHVPQLEQQDRVTRLVNDFLG